jgi:hypothetical protein
MEVTREYVVDVLRRAGLWDVANEVEASLPETNDMEHVREFLFKRGVTRDSITSLLGGSP